MLLIVLVFGCASACSRAIDPALFQDAQLAVRVKTVLVNDSVLGVRPIEVTVTGGVARLSGNVASEAEAERAIDLVRAVGGVREVRTELVVRTEPSEDTLRNLADEPESGRPSRIPKDGGELRGEPGLLAVGVTFRHSRPGDGGLESAIRLGPLFRLGSGSGLGFSLGLGWFSADLSSSSLPVGRVRFRPVMAGLAYTVVDARLSASFSLVGGAAFNSLSEQHRSQGPVWVLGVRNSMVWRPGVSLWFDLGRRTALNVSAAHVMTRPRFSLLENGRVRTQTLRGDTTLVSTGLVYKLF